MSSSSSSSSLIKSTTFQYFLFGTEKSVLMKPTQEWKWTCPGDFQKIPPVASQIRSFGEDHCLFRNLSKTQNAQCFIAVSDGVSSSKIVEGVSSGPFSHQLIRSTHLCIDRFDFEKHNVISPGDVTNRMWNLTKKIAQENHQIRGGATYSLVRITSHPETKSFSISASVLGDSRFAILSFSSSSSSPNKCQVEYLSPQQTHQRPTSEGRYPPFQFNLWNSLFSSTGGFNNLCKMLDYDDASDPLLIYTQAKEGCVVILASDGFWDNLFLMARPLMELNRNDEEQKEIKYHEEKQKDIFYVQKAFDLIFPSYSEISDFKNISSCISSFFINWSQRNQFVMKIDDISCVMVSLGGS